MTEEVWIVSVHHEGCSGFAVVEGVFASEASAEKLQSTLEKKFERQAIRVYTERKKVRP